jgi:hypothetical protein
VRRIKVNEIADVTLTSANTNYQLSSDTTLRSPSILIQAPSANTGIVRVGSSAIDSTKGIMIEAGKSAVIEYDGPDCFLSDLYARSTGAGDKVVVSFLKEF